MLLEKIRRELESKDENFDRYLYNQKLASLGHLVGGLSHCFNNILGGILGYSQLLKDELAEDSNAHRQAAIIEKGAKRAAKLVSQLQIFSRKPNFRKRIVDPKIVIEELLLILKSATNRNIRVKTRFGHGHSKIYSDISALSQCILNICLNSSDAMAEGGQLRIATSIANHEEPLLKIEVKDTGSGIQEKHLPHIFDPFFTTKDMLSGTGLGLTVAREIVNYHDGEIEVQSELAKGTTVTLTFPVNTKPVVVEEEMDSITRGDKLGNGEMILVVDDEEDLRDMAKRILEKKGFEVLLAGSGQEALKLFKSEKKVIQVVILDMILPSIGGEQIYREMKSASPDLRVILTSGIMNSAPFEALIKDSSDSFLPKPWDLPKFLQEVKAALEL